MEEPFDDGAQDFPPCIESFYPPQEPAYACFRCGNCCRLWVFLTGEEADRITGHIKLARNEFTIEYWDRSVSSEECLVIRQQDGACFFLKDSDDRREKYCSIYELRPGVCREFVPSLMRRECRNGLTKFWNLTATPTGRIEGSEEQVKAFNAYLKALVFGWK